MIQLADIRTNDHNPRFIRDERFAKLVKSIQEFPEMMALRPIVVDADNMVLGGNMRLRALQEAGYKEVPTEWIKQASELTEEQQRRFIIADNVGFGQWDWDLIGNEWDVEELADWGLDTPTWTENDDDYSDRNKELDVDDFEDNLVIKLEYTLEDYEKVKTALHKIAPTPEAAVWTLLNLDND